MLVRIVSIVVKLDNNNICIKISGTNKLIINKCDILQEINIYKLILDNDKDGPNFIKFNDFDNMKEYITNEFKEYCEITFSGNKSFI